MTPSRQAGRIVAAHGRHYLVEPAKAAMSVTDSLLNSAIQCFPRGKNSDFTVGDHVWYELRSDHQGVIVDLVQRRNLLYRSDAYRIKLFAANLDTLLIVLATEPYFSEDLLGRALVAASAQDLPALILLNKTDIASALPAARERLALYRALGYPIVELSVRAEPQAALATLLPYLAGRTSLLLGQSGMGKSSLINLLVPNAEAATREISTALNSGKHTTSFTRLYTLPNTRIDNGQINTSADAAHASNDNGALIDSPGFQEFGLGHLTEGQLERGFPEFIPYLSACRFYNCQHLREPGCGVLEAVKSGAIAVARHGLYAQLVKALAINELPRTKSTGNHKFSQ